MASIDRPLSIPLSVLDTAPSRPVYAQGPQSLGAVKLLRISITDRCNFRCVYCMPEDGVRFYERSDLLTADDILRVAEAAREAGVTHFKVTGGEPTIRQDLCEIVSRLKQLDPIDLSLTTNGVLLDRLALPLKQAGLDRITLSLDTLQPDRFEKVTGGRGRIDAFWRGVQAIESAGFRKIKVNAVIIGGFNDDEVPDLVQLSLDHDWTVRFIEYMPLGESQLLVDGLAQGNALTVDNAELAERIQAVFGPLQPIGSNGDQSTRPDAGVGPAQVFEIAHPTQPHRGRVGFISAMSRPFCETCNRLRLTANGELRACLFDGGEIDLVPLLRNPHTTRRTLIRAMDQCVVQKPETHAEWGNRQMSQLGG